MDYGFWVYPLSFYEHTDKSPGRLSKPLNIVNHHHASYYGQTSIPENIIIFTIVSGGVNREEETGLLESLCLSIERKSAKTGVCAFRIICKNGITDLTQLLISVEYESLKIRNVGRVGRF